MADIVTIDGIPVYKALVDSEDTGMMRISLVDDPAVMSDFLAFSAEGKQLLTYAVQDEEKRLVLGVVMRADFPIYRRTKMEDGKDFEYYITYSPETIRAMAEKYLAENRQNLVNLMHEKNTEVDGVQMVQYFIKGDGLNPDGFEGIADGSLFAEFHVTNDEIWGDIKAGTYKGFSLEGFFNLVPEKDAGLVQEIVDALDGKFSKIETYKNKRNMSKVKGLLARLAAALVEEEMGNITTDKGVLSWDGQEELKVGDKVYITDAEGNRIPAEDGEYTIADDSRVAIVAGGEVTEIREASAPAEEPAEEPSQEQAAEEPDGKGVNTDKGMLYWMGTEDLKEGDDVFVDGEGEEGLVAAADGEYTTEDGKVISVVDGKVASITDPKAEVATKEPELNAFQRIAQQFQETFEDKLKAIYKAIEELGFSYPWIVEAGEEFCIAEFYNEDGYIYYRFTIKEWDEDGKPVLENGVKVVPAFVTPEEKEAADAAFQSMKEDFEKVRTELETLKNTPAGKPAHQEFNNGGEVNKTGNKGLDRLARIVSAK